MRQGDPASQIIFNILVDALVRAVLEVVCSPQEAQYGMGWAAGNNLVFYADDIRIAGQYHDWVHDALAVTAAMFCKMRLEANLEKTKAMVCTRRLIWGEWRDTTYKQPETGKGATLREQKKT